VWARHGRAGKSQIDGRASRARTRRPTDAKETIGLDGTDSCGFQFLEIVAQNSIVAQMLHVPSAEKQKEECSRLFLSGRATLSLSQWLDSYIWSSSRTAGDTTSSTGIEQNDCDSANGADVLQTRGHLLGAGPDMHQHKEAEGSPATNDVDDMALYYRLFLQGHVDLSLSQWLDCTNPSSHTTDDITSSTRIERNDGDSAHVLLEEQRQTIRTQRLADAARDLLPSPMPTLQALNLPPQMPTLQALHDQKSPKPTLPASPLDSAVSAAPVFFSFDDMNSDHIEELT